jgi:uncharacterized membrane protein
VAPALGASDERAPALARIRGAGAERIGTITIAAAMGIWSLALVALVRDQFETFRIGRFDLGNMVQAVWSTTQGRPLEATTATGEQASRLGTHVDPILAALAPLYALVPSPMTLALVQVVAVSLGALPLLWLGRKHLASERAAVLLALAYLASPWIAWTASDAMHPKTLAIPCFLFAVWYLDENRLLPFGIAALLAAACGELMGLTIAALGAWYALARGRRRAGAAIAVAGAAWTLVALEVVVPAFSGGASPYYGLYASVGGSPAGIVRTAFADPLAILAALTGRDELLYVLLLAAPLLGLFVTSPALAAVAVPQIAVNMLADASGPTDPRHHYIAGVVPFLAAATVLGIGRLASARRVAAAAAVLATSVALSLLFGPWPVSVDRAPLRYELEAPAGHAEVLRRAAALVPDGLPVTASNKVGSHLAERRYLFVVPVLGNDEVRAEWVVLDTYDRWLSYRSYPFLVERPREELEAFREQLLVDAEWVVRFSEAGVYVFERRRS